MRDAYEMREFAGVPNRAPDLATAFDKTTKPCPWVVDLAPALPMQRVQEGQYISGLGYVYPVK